MLEPLETIAARRSAPDIVSSILDLCKKPQSKTNVMYGENLSYSRTEKFLDFLIANGLLDLERGGPRRTKYGYHNTTKKGLECLDDYFDLKDYFEGSYDDEQITKIDKSEVLSKINYDRILGRTYDNILEERRNKYDIVADILIACVNPTSKRDIMESISFNWLQTTRYLDFLVKRGLLEKERDGPAGNGFNYHIIQQGYWYLDAYRKFMSHFSVR